MMRSVLFALMFSGSVFAFSANASAQSSPDTRQTDQSEEDWRKSKKKGGSSTEDILDIIKNTRSSGVGNGRGYSPIDALPEESRRHLMKERAKRMAQAGPNEPVDVSYKPSEAAKSDSNLEADEKAAWEEMSKSMNGAPDQGQSQGQGQGQSQGQSQQGQQGQQGQQNSGQSGQGQPPGWQGQRGQRGQQQGQGQSRSVMRGGSAASVSDIMNRIKGVNPSNNGAGQNQSQQGQSQQDQIPQEQNGQGQNGQEQIQTDQTQPVKSQSREGQTGQAEQDQRSSKYSEYKVQSGQEEPSQSEESLKALAEAQAQAESQSRAQAQAKAKTESQSQSASIQDASEATDVTRVPEAISPLDRIKKVNREDNSSGRRSSASDFIRGD